jgi:hypothetical protein
MHFAFGSYGMKNALHSTFIQREQRVVKAWVLEQNDQTLPSCFWFFCGHLALPAFQSAFIWLSPLH